MSAALEQAMIGIHNTRNVTLCWHGADHELRRESVSWWQKGTAHVQVSVNYLVGVSGVIAPR